MTAVIINDILPLTQAIAVGSQTVYSTDWTANFASDVVVYSRATGIAANDVTQVLSPSQFNVAFIGSGNIVQVTLITPSTAGDIVTITRMTPADRLNLYTNTNFTPSMLNNDFDILTLVDQQAQLVNQQIAPRYNYSEIINNVVDTILPILAANQLWVKNPSNTAIIAANINTMGTGSVSLGLQNQLAYYAATGTVVSGLSTLANAALLTNSSGAPGFVAYTGTGAPVLANSPALINPVLGAATATTIKFAQGNGIIDVNSNPLLLFNTVTNAVNYAVITNAATGNTPGINAGGSDTNIILELGGQGTGGVSIQGTGTNNNSSPGFVGEVISSIILNASAVSVTSTVARNVTSISLTAGDWDIYGNVFFNVGGNCTALNCWISTTSAVAPDPSSIIQTNLSGALIGNTGFNAPYTRLSIATTTTVYLSVNSIFTTSTLTASGAIYARRAR